MSEKERVKCSLTQSCELFIQCVYVIVYLRLQLKSMYLRVYMCGCLCVCE